jgi:hypothetical protein
MAELRDKALAAVEEAARAALKGPIERTAALRFALAFLANFTEDRSPFDLLWRELAEPLGATEAERVGRRQTLRNLAGFIHRLLECEPPDF